MLPRLWDTGGAISSANVPRYRSSALAPSRYPYAPHTGYLVNLPTLHQRQDLRTSHVKLDNFIHGNITGLTNAMKKFPGLINIINPALMRPTPTNHEQCSPYDRQSSRMSFTVTARSYIRVTQILKLHVESASPYEGHTSRINFARLLDPTSGLLRNTSGLTKILPWLRLTLLTTLSLWGAPSERPRQEDAPSTTPRRTRVRPSSVYYPKMGSDTFLSMFRLCSCGTKPQRSENYHFVMMLSWEPQCHRDIIMRTPRITGKPRFSCSRGPKITPN